MTERKFKLGQRVRYASGMLSPQLRPAPIYTITRLMPITTRGYQYRIKGDAEPHERVAEEAQLEGAFAF